MSLPVDYSVGLKKNSAEAGGGTNERRIVEEERALRAVASSNFSALSGSERSTDAESQKFGTLERLQRSLNHAINCLICLFCNAGPKAFQKMYFSGYAKIVEAKNAERKKLQQELKDCLKVLEKTNAIRSDELETLYKNKYSEFSSKCNTPARKAQIKKELKALETISGMVVESDRSGGYDLRKVEGESILDRFTAIDNAEAIEIQTLKGQVKNAAQFFMGEQFEFESILSESSTTSSGDFSVTEGLNEVAANNSAPYQALLSPETLKKTESTLILSKTFSDAFSKRAAFFGQSNQNNASVQTIVDESVSAAKSDDVKFKLINELTAEIDKLSKEITAIQTKDPVRTGRLKGRVNVLNAKKEAISLKPGLSPGSVTLSRTFSVEGFVGSLSSADGSAVESRLNAKNETINPEQDSRSGSGTLVRSVATGGNGVFPAATAAIALSGLGGSDSSDSDLSDTEDL